MWPTHIALISEDVEAVKDTQMFDLICFVKDSTSVPNLKKGKEAIKVEKSNHLYLAFFFPQH